MGDCGAEMEAWSRVTQPVGRRVLPPGYFAGLGLGSKLRGQLTVAHAEGHTMVLASVSAQLMPASNLLTVAQTEHLLCALALNVAGVEGGQWSVS